MKITHTNPARHNEHGLVTFVFIALLAIMLLLVVANGKSLIQLRREIKLLEQQQIKWLNASQTNSVVATNLNLK